MNALGGGGYGGLWGWNSSSPRKPKQPRRRPFDSKSQSSSNSNSVDATGRARHWFPLMQAATAGSLALTGDTIAQLTQRWRKAEAENQQGYENPQEATGRIVRANCILANKPVDIEVCN
ncbi:hypothetical protein ACFX1S_047087 [Malus domestica]